MPVPARVLSPDPVDRHAATWPYSIPKALRFGASPDTVRRWTWRNLKAISEKLSLVKMFPHDFQVQFLAV